MPDPSSSVAAGRRMAGPPLDPRPVHPEHEEDGAVGDAESKKVVP